MSAKKGSRAKVLPKLQQESQKGSSKDATDSPNLSSIERASFLEGLQQHHGNPLHSTAMEDELKVPEEDRMSGPKAGRKETPPTAKTAVKQRGVAVKRKETERDEEEEEEEGKKKRSRRSAGGTRPGENQQMKKGKKRGSETGSGKSSDAAPQEKPDAAHKRVLSSEEEEEEDEDTSWKPSPKKATALRLGKSRKSSSDGPKSRRSSSGGASAEPEKARREKQRRSRRGGGGGTETEVVLDAFLEFCDQYRESVESKAVKRAVDSFSSSVEEQLLEKISSSKEFKVLRRENAKVGSSISAKTQRLLDAKHELMRAERQAWLLQEENAELKGRLADLRRGRSFLQDIRELSRRYLDHRHQRPKEKEMYGASSLPALLLETKLVQTAKHKLGATGKRLKNGPKKNKTVK